MEVFEWLHLVRRKLGEIRKRVSEMAESERAAFCLPGYQVERVDLPVACFRLTGGEKGELSLFV